MDKDSIAKWQAARIRDALYKHLNYLFRLRERMQKCGFPPQDPLFVHVCKAYDAVQALYTRLNYLSCDGAGRPSGT